ncbi:phosphotransferase family protein [Parahaliea mediterranea]|uniref:phosphotransferase family protein n=1 Tax=Parahaliea mediterranea TaxID=651086 RepID=UPI0019D45610|nr:aminoglycoside phosphotransferase family protein [Parahaliea mediterranea]
MQQGNDSGAQLPDSLRSALQGMGLLEPGEPVRAQPLTGGVASDIWRVQSGPHDYCVKRALAQLRVARDWQVPTHRNAYEVAWLEQAAAIAPGSVPRVLGHDPEAGVFAMQYFAPEHYRNWKQELAAGRVALPAVASLATLLARIHSATAGDATLARRFDNGELFFQLRLEPYLHGAAERHPALAPYLLRLAEAVSGERRVMVHGDVSPKNILVGEGGVVLLDAECACIGDPAFDLAFCLNHLLLKCLWQPAGTPDYLAAYQRLCRDYLAAVDWEPPSALASRAAHLLPGLLLARVDGKSPVEYLQGAQQQQVRQFATFHLINPPDDLAALAHAWRQSL